MYAGSRGRTWNYVDKLLTRHFWSVRQINAWTPKDKHGHKQDGGREALKWSELRVIFTVSSLPVALLIMAEKRRPAGNNFEAVKKARLQEIADKANTTHNPVPIFSPIPGRSRLARSRQKPSKVKRVDKVKHQEPRSLEWKRQEPIKMKRMWQEPSSLERMREEPIKMKRMWQKPSKMKWMWQEPSQMKQMWPEPSSLERMREGPIKMKRMWQEPSSLKRMREEPIKMKRQETI